MKREITLACEAAVIVTDLAEDVQKVIIKSKEILEANGMEISKGT